MTSRGNIIPYKALVFLLTDNNYARDGSREDSLVQCKALTFNSCLVSTFLFLSTFLFGVLIYIPSQIFYKFTFYLPGD